MAYFITDSGMNFAYKSNQEQRRKQRKRSRGSINFFAWKCEKMHFMENSEKIKFYKCGLKWKRTPGDEKIPSTYESTTIEKDKKDVLIWMVYQNCGVMSKKMHHYVIGCQDGEIILMMDFLKEGIELNDSFVCFHVI